MKITQDKWQEILKYYGGMQQISMIGSVSPTGQPNVTPIGAIVLQKDCSGYYFDIFAKELSNNLDQNKNVCVLFAETGRMFWFKSLYSNKCKKPAGIKLIGSAGNKRKATAEEIEKMGSRAQGLKKLKGYNTLFGNLSYVRDIQFTDYFILNIGKMTFNL